MSGMKQAAAQTADRRGKVQVVDRRAVGQQGVACRIHPSGDGPDHILPVADVDVVIDHHDEFGVHELAQKTPDAKHHPPGVAGVGLLDLHHRQWPWFRPPAWPCTPPFFKTTVHRSLWSKAPSSNWCA